MKKKLLALVLTLAMVVSLFPVALATDENEDAGLSSQSNAVAQIENGDTYDSLSQAFSQAETGQTITLLSNATLDNDVTISEKKITLNLNEKKLTSQYKITISNAGALTIDGNGEIDFTGQRNSTGFLILGDTTYKNGEYTGKTPIYSTLTIKSGTISSGTSYVVYLSGYGATMNLEGGTIHCTYKNSNKDGDFAITGNGTRNGTNDDGGIFLNITGGTVESDQDCAIYLPGYNVTNISGDAVIKGWCGIEIDSGNLTISGNPTIQSTYQGDGTRKYKESGDGNYNFGAALAIVSKGSQSETSYYGHMNIEISGGTFISESYYAIDEYNLKYVQTKNEENNIGYIDSLEITGGNFEGAEGKIILSDNQEDFVSGGTFSSDPTTYLATGYEATKVSESLDQWKVDLKTNGGMAVTAPETSSNTVTATLDGVYKNDETVIDKPSGSENSNETDNDNGDLVVDVQTTGNSTTTTTLTVAQNTAESLKAANSLTVKTDVGDVKLDDTALDTLSKAQVAVQITITENKEESTTTGWTVTATANGEELFAADENGANQGTITISVPYTGDATDNVIVYCVDDGMEEMETKIVEATEGGNKYLTWETPHLSTFASIVYGENDEAGWVIGTGTTATTGHGAFQAALAALSSQESGSTFAIQLIDDPKALTTDQNQSLITIPEGKKVTIQSGAGGPYTITATYKGDIKPTTGNDKPVLSLKKGSELTLSNVILKFSSTESSDKTYHTGDGIQLLEGSKLILENNAKVTLDMLHRGLVHYSGSSVEMDSATLNVTNIDANGSNGGTWEIKNGSIVNFTTIGNHGLSVDKLTVDNSKVTVDGAGYSGIVSADFTMTNGADVTVKNSGKLLPYPAGDSVSQWAPNGSKYNFAVELKDSGKLTVDNSALTLTNNKNSEKKSIDTIYVHSGDVASLNDSTIVATIETADNSQTKYYTVTYMNDTDLFDSVVVPSTNTTYTIIAGPSKTGYTFEGWQSSAADKKIYQAGESVNIIGNTTFTAVWKEIPKPVEDPGEKITITSATHGKVTTSASGGYADAGSTVTITVTPDKGYELHTLRVRDTNGTTVAYRDLGNGKYSFVMPEGGVTITALFAEVEEKEPLPFTDVPETEWYYDEVYYVWENGLMNGVGGSRFAPEDDTSRAMFITTVWRMEGEPKSTYTLNYNDVGENLWYTEAVRWATEHGIMEGYDGGFHPDDAMTREQLAAILYRYAQYKGYDTSDKGNLSQFTDQGTISGWSRDYMVWAVGAGMLQGSANQITPMDSAIRAQTATILMRFLENVAK